MNEVDDRLFGDPVWELFADPNPEFADPFHAKLYWLIAAGTVAALWLASPTLAVSMACLSVALPDFRRGRMLSRSIPVKAGGSVCAKFAYAWGFWKVGVTAFFSVFVTIILSLPAGKKPEMPAGSLISLQLWLAGFSASAVFTAMGLLSAYRSGMRIWIGEGINRARTLLKGMLFVAFGYLIIPLCVWLVDLENNEHSFRIGGIILICYCVGGPTILLFILDRISRHVVAKRPGKFGPKVSAVGKWNS